MTLSKETNAEIDRLFEEGLLPDRKISEKVGCSHKTVHLRRQAREAEAATQRGGKW